jgi:hypothetical protein
MRRDDDSGALAIELRRFRCPLGTNEGGLVEVYLQRRMVYFSRPP